MLHPLFVTITSCAPYTLLVALLLNSGCAPTFRELQPGTRMQIEGNGHGSAVVEQQSVSVTPLEADPPSDQEYRIGAGDVLYINISGKQEFFTSPPTSNNKVQGSRVDGAGRVQIPIAGAVTVAGLTLPQAQEAVRSRLTTYLRNPWVVIEVAEYKSQPIYLLGSFRGPGTYYMDRPITLLQGIALAGGFDVNTANLRSARLNRGGAIQPVDVYSLLTSGDQRRNVWLKSGDTIYIPDRSLQQIFIFGSVQKPGPVPMLNGQLNLAQAIAAAQLRDTGYDLTHVRIIRSNTTTSGELIVIDFERIMRGQALPFVLQEGDIVYVPRSVVGSWNDAVAEILPSLQAVSALLQPFVNIKFLSK